MASIFVDTSAFYGLADRADRTHLVARQIAEQLRGGDLVTSNLVLAESWLLTRSRLGRPAALDLWATIRNGAAVIEPVDQRDLDRAWTIATDFADQDFSLVDCTSFALIERLGIRQAFSFDRDFLIFRYGPRRGAQLEVLGLSSL